jgi:hypothetical protein
MKDKNFLEKRKSRDNFCSKALIRKLLCKKLHLHKIELPLKEKCCILWLAK